MPQVRSTNRHRNRINPSIKRIRTHWDRQELSLDPIIGQSERRKLIESIFANLTSKKLIIGDLRMDMTRVSSEKKIHMVVTTKLANTYRFLVMVGISYKLWKVRGVWGWVCEVKTLEPEECICKPWPFPRKIWSGPSKRVFCWRFLASSVTWNEAPESGCQDAEAVGAECAMKALGGSEKLVIGHGEGGLIQLL